MWRAASMMLVLSALCGCARDRVIIAPDTAQAVPLPLFLRGQDTQFKLHFPKAEQTAQPGDFQRDEICYLRAGDFRVDCYTDGSALNLGPNDSTTLLSDNPMNSLESADGNKPARDYLRLYGIVFLVGGSVDRLPQTLADYLGEPGQHQNEAVALARLLLSSKALNLNGYARGGSFIVTVQLTGSGRDKLVDALDQIGEQMGPTQLVGLRGRRHPGAIDDSARAGGVVSGKSVSDMRR